MHWLLYSNGSVCVCVCRECFAVLCSLSLYADGCFLLWCLQLLESKLMQLFSLNASFTLSKEFTLWIDSCVCVCGWMNGVFWHICFTHLTNCVIVWVHVCVFKYQTLTALTELYLNALKTHCYTHTEPKQMTSTFSSSFKIPLYSVFGED